MAPRVVDVTIRGKDESKPAFDSAKSNAKGMGDGITSLLNPMSLLKGAIAGVGLSTLVGFFRASVTSAGEAEASWTRAAQALTNAGISAGLARPQIDAMATSIQKSTRYSDDAATDAFATLLNVSGDYAGSLQNVSLAANIAAAKQIDLKDAAQLVGKVMAGETGMLKRYGIVVAEGADAMSVLNERFSGFAESDGKSMQGRLAQLANGWDNVLEAMGRAITGTDTTADATGKLVDQLNGLGVWIDENSGGIKGLIDNVATLTEKLIQLGKRVSVVQYFPLFAFLRSGIGQQLLGFGSKDVQANRANAAAGRANDPLAERAEIEAEKALAEESAANAKKVKAEKDKKATEEAAKEHAKYLERLKKEVAELSRAHELGTLRADDLRRLLELQEKLETIARGSGSLAERNAAAAGAAALAKGSPLGPPPGVQQSATSGATPMANITLSDIARPAELGGGAMTAPGAEAGPDTSAGHNFADGFRDANDTIAETRASIANLSFDIGTTARDAVVAFGLAWGDAASTMTLSAAGVGQAIMQSGRKAISGVVSAKGDETLLDASKAFTQGFTNPVMFAVAGKLFAIGTGYKALAGALGGSGGGGGGGGGGGAGLSASARSDSSDATGELGQVNVTLNGRKLIVDASDPDEQDGFMAMLMKLTGNRRLNLNIVEEG